MIAIAPAWTVTPAPGTYVNTVDIDASATRIVAGTFYLDYAQPANRQFGTFCYDGSGVLQWMQPIETSFEGVYWTAIAPGAQVVASGGAVQHVEKGPITGFLQVIDGPTGKITYSSTGIVGRVSRVAFSNDGSVLAACAGQAIYTAALDGSACARGLQHAAVESTAVTIDVSPDGQWVVTGTSQGAVHLFRCINGVPQWVQQWINPDGLEIRSVTFSDAGPWFAVCGGDAGKNGMVGLFNTQDFATRSQPVWNEKLPRISYAVALSGGGETTAPAVIVSSNVGKGGAVMRYDTPASAPMPAWTVEMPGAPNCIAANKGVLAIADGYPENSPGHFTCMSAADGAVQWQFETANMSWPIAIAAGTGDIAAGSDDCNVYLFRA